MERMEKTKMHLAELLEEEMNARGWTLDDLVMNMGPHFTPEEWGICHLSWDMFFTLRTPDVILGDVMAQQLGDAFDVTPAFFTNFHEAWRRAEKSVN
jgi:hypothetical protein